MAVPQPYQIPGLGQVRQAAASSVFLVTGFTLELDPFARAVDVTGRAPRLERKQPTPTIHYSLFTSNTSNYFTAKLYMDCRPAGVSNSSTASCAPELTALCR